MWKQEIKKREVKIMQEELRGQVQYQTYRKKFRLDNVIMMCICAQFGEERI